MVEVMVEVVGLYPSIPHELDLKPLGEALEKREPVQIPTSNLVKTTKFALQNKYFEFNRETKQQISSTAIGTKFACIFMDQVGPELLKIQINRTVSMF